MITFALRPPESFALIIPNLRRIKKRPNPVIRLRMLKRIVKLFRQRKPRR